MKKKERPVIVTTAHRGRGSRPGLRLASGVGGLELHEPSEADALKVSKYRNVKIVVDGITFDSKREATRYGELKLLQKQKLIERLRLQPRFKIELNGRSICTYIADFEYWDCEKQNVVVEDVKGIKTAVYRLKKKLVLACFGIEIQEV